MEKQQHIDKYFQAAREIPLAISVSQVETIITNFGGMPPKSKVWTTKTLKIMITSVITTSAIVFTLLTVNTTPKEPIESVIPIVVEKKVSEEIEMPSLEKDNDIPTYVDTSEIEIAPIRINTKNIEALKAQSEVKLQENIPFPEKETKPTSNESSIFPEKISQTNDNKNQIIDNVSSYKDNIEEKVIEKQKGDKNGNGKITKSVRDIGDFHSLELSSALEIVLTQEGDIKVEVETDENLQEHLITEVKNGVLQISFDNKVGEVTKAKVYINFKTLKSISSSGASDITNKGQLTLQNFALNISGSSDINLNFTSEKLECDLSGASNIHFDGKTNNCTIGVSGACEIDAFDLEISKCNLDVSGASDIHINVTDELSISASGVCEIIYSGSPTIIKKDISGFTNIEKK